MGRPANRQLPFCGAALLVGVVYICPTTWASLGFPEEHGGSRRSHAYGSESRQREDDVPNVSEQMSGQEVVFVPTGPRRFGGDI